MTLVITGVETKKKKHQKK